MSENRPVKSLRLTGMRGFLTLWAGQLVSTIGSGLTAWGLGVWIYKETGSPTLFVLSLLALTLPNVLLGPLAGLIVDRYDRRRIMLFSDSLAALTTLSVALLISLDQLQVWHIYVTSFLYAIGSTFQWPAYGASTTLLVPKAQLGRAGGLVQVGEGMSQVITPGLAGVLFVTVGLRGIILVDLVTFLIALASTTMTVIPSPDRTASEALHESFWHEITFGWRYIAARRGLLAILIYFAVANFFGSISLPLLTPMLLDTASPETVGLIGTVAGAGMLAGTITMSAWGGPKRRAFAIILGDLVGGLFMILTGLTPYIPLIVIAQFGFMFAIPITNANSQALWQSKVDPGVQGRVFSVRRMIAFSIIPIAYIAAGPLSEYVFRPLLIEGGPLAASVGTVIGVGPSRGLGLMMMVCGALYSLAALAALIYPRSRRVDLELPDAQPDEEIQDVTAQKAAATV
jgi:MFS transporter